MFRCRMRPRLDRISAINQFPWPQIPHFLLILTVYFLNTIPFLSQQPLEVIPIDILWRVAILFVKEHYVAMPLLHPIIRTLFLVKPDTDVVLPIVTAWTELGLSESVFPERITQMISFSRLDSSFASWDLFSSFSSSSDGLLAASKRRSSRDCLKGVAEACPSKIVGEGCQSWGYWEGTHGV